MKVSDIEVPKDRKLINRDFCDSCDQMATKLIITQVGDREQRATRLERYCQKHYDLIINK